MDFSAKRAMVDKKMSIPDTHTEDSNNKSSTANICDCSIGMRERKLETHSENAYEKKQNCICCNSPICGRPTSPCTCHGIRRTDTRLGSISCSQWRLRFLRWKPHTWPSTLSPGKDQFDKKETVTQITRNTAGN